MMDALDINDITVFLIIFALSLWICHAIYDWIRKRNYPPGPKGFPIVGYAPFLLKNPYLALRDLSKIYGDVFSFYIGPQLVVVVSDHRLAKEILSNPLTFARPSRAFDHLTGGGGFGGRNGEEWQEQRRFAIHTMRNLGLGKGLWETMIQVEAAEFVKHIEKYKGQPVYFEDTLAVSQVINNLSLLFGRHLDVESDKEDIEVLLNSSKKMAEHFTSIGLFVVFPRLAKLLKMVDLFGFKQLINTIKMFDEIFKKEVNRRLESKENMEKEDFIGYYLREIEKHKSDAKPSTFTVDALLGNLFALFIAGEDSTLSSISWLLLLMAKHSDIQKKVCDEIDKVIGRDSIIYYDDKIKLPYTVATISEALRYTPFLPLFLPRQIIKTFTFNGYTIPQGSLLVCNNWAMHHDPRYFEEPMKFKPERFLTENESKFVKIEGYGPFSFGKRNCPAEGVAMMTIYLYFVSIMQKFLIKTPHGIPPDMSYKSAMAVIPQRQQLCFIER